MQRGQGGPSWVNVDPVICSTSCGSPNVQVAGIHSGARSTGPGRHDGLVSSLCRTRSVCRAGRREGARCSVRKEIDEEGAPPPCPGMLRRARVPCGHTATHHAPFSTAGLAGVTAGDALRGVLARRAADSRCGVIPRSACCSAWRIIVEGVRQGLRERESLHAADASARTPDRPPADSVGAAGHGSHGPRCHPRSSLLVIRAWSPEPVRLFSIAPAIARASLAWRCAASLRPCAEHNRAKAVSASI